MIITRIQSENFLKYKVLDLNHLPEKGLITVSGQNESGKTSLGETVCFALFGRTFTLELDDPVKLIRWGESRCSVSIAFVTQDGEEYELTRYLDNEGTYGARLSRTKDGAVLAKGIEHVADRLHPLIGFGYDEFIESFYLAQRELTTPHPHSHTIKVMAGIAPLAKTRSELEVSIAEEQQALDVARADHFEAQNQLADLGIDTTWLPDLEEARQLLAEQREEQGELIAGLERANHDYARYLPQLRRKQSAKRFTNFFAGLFLLLTAVLWTGWYLLMSQPDLDISAVISQWLTSHFPDWQAAFASWLLPAAVVTSGLTVIAFIQGWRQKAQMNQLKVSASTLSVQLGEIKASQERKAVELPEAVRPLLKNKPRNEALDEAHGQGDKNDFIVELASLESRSGLFQITPEKAGEVVVRIDKTLEQALGKTTQRIEYLDGAIEKEQKRLAEASNLTGISADLNAKVNARLRNIKIREVSNSLLDSASHHLSHRFNQSILKLAGGALPKFTRDRYQHLKIDENLDVRVFSNEKRDFMGFEEISSGTQRQIMLSLRLAMSQELVHAIDCGKQFIFFDEPFAFFDQERIRETLQAIPGFSDDLSQVWLVAQEFPEGIEPTLEVRCMQETVEMRTG